MHPALRSALREAMSVLFPVECAGCGRADHAVCDECRAALEPELTPRSLDPGVDVVTAVRYDGVVRRTLLALKEHDRTDTARALAVPLRAAVDRAVVDAGGPRRAEVLAVPSSRAAYRRRGYDPVALLLRAARVSAVRVLARPAGGAAQKTLGVEERARNLAGTLRARHPLGNRRFVLVDDVLTTGATLREARRAVEAAGGRVVGAAALAFTPRLFARPADSSAAPRDFDGGED